MKYLLFLLCIFPLFISAQSFTDADTCFDNVVTNITYNSASINTNTGNGDVGGTQVVLKYVRVGHTDTVTASSPWPNGLRNLTGLQASTQYVYYYAFSLPPEWVPQQGRYYFTTLATTVTYAAERATVFPYVKTDSGFKVPRGDTLLYRAPNTSGGDLVFKTSNGKFYGWNGSYWQEFGSITGVSNKVDSVTVAGDSLWYWINGVQYGYILPTAVVPTWQQTLTTGSTLTGNNTIAGGGFDLEFTNNGKFYGQAITGSKNNYLSLYSTASVLGSADLVSAEKNSAITVYSDSITLKPYLGQVYIDTLTNAVGTRALRYNPTTGLVSYADTTSGGSGVSTLAAIGSSPNANGATISGSTLNLEPASASFGGVVTTGTQTFAGVKTLPTPVFTTSAQVPLIIGSTSASGTLSLQSTSNGTRGSIIMVDSVNFSGKTIENYSAKYNVQTGISYTLVAADNGKILTFDNGSDITLTVPASLPAGFTCTVVQLGAGEVVFTASSTTLHNRSSFTKTGGQYAVAAITMYAANTFIFGGDCQ